MKKKILSLLFTMFLILPCMFVLSGCGEQFIEERNYNLLGMTVIKDNTPYIYSPFDEGEYATSFCGGMRIEKTTLNVGRQSSVMVFDDSETTGIKATYVFDVYTGSEVYPAYTFKSYDIQINNMDATNLTESEISGLSNDVQKLYKEVKQFSNVCSLGETSIQLVTQNKSLCSHIIVLNPSDGSLMFMSMLYGY